MVRVLVALVLTATTSALVYRASYQPLERGGLFGGTLERLTDGVDMTGVKVTEGHGGSYDLSIYNAGRFDVTIVDAGWRGCDVEIRPTAYRLRAAEQEDSAFTPFVLAAGSSVELTLDVQLRDCSPNILSTVSELRVRYRFLGHERDQWLPLEVPIKAVCP